MSAITVLIPCYNEAPFIATAVTSVMNQEFTDWELVIVDDGSDDGTSEILDSILVQQPLAQITVIASEHKGCAAATDQAARFAISPLCTILDGDDELQPHSLSTIIEFFKENTIVNYAWTRYIARSTGGTRWKEGRSKALPSGRTLKQALLSGWWGALAQRSFRREAYLATGGLDHSLPYAVDQQLAMLFARAGCEVAHIPKVTYQHLQHGQQMSAQHYRDQQYCRGEILKRLGGTYVRER